MKCGHRTQRSGSVSAFGHSVTTKMPKNDNGSVDYCPGPRAGFFSSSEPSEAQKGRERREFVIPDGAVVYRENPLILVGCLGWNCADTGADRAGFWLPGENSSGYVHRAQTAYETILGAEEPSMMIVGDPSDMKEAANPTLILLGSQRAK